jgi:hypothetical protein
LLSGFKYDNPLRLKKKQTQKIKEKLRGGQKRRAAESFSCSRRMMEEKILMMLRTMEKSF